ncbi:MAG: beta-propeller fold lactonase family protein [Planctomycetales bacterium]|nr:beta-propeller fold lactonase family protein [Planctomycetales bacterium]
MKRLCILVTSVLFSFVTAHGAEPFHLYAPDSENNRVLQFNLKMDGDKLHIQPEESVALPFSPQSITTNARTNQLIVTTGSQEHSQCAVIQMNSAGAPEVLQVSELDHPSGYTSLDRTGHFLVTVNYSSGVIAVYRLHQSGQVDRLCCCVTTPRPEAHCILTTPDNRFAYVPCVKTNNALYQFAFDQTNGQLEPLTSFDVEPPAMFGPRHIAYHPSLPICYFSNEQQLGLSAYRIGQNGQLSEI